MATVADIPDSELVERAVRNAHHERPAAPRWVQVMSAFALGSTYAKQLCARFWLDPEEVVGEEPEELEEEE